LWVANYQTLRTTALISFNFRYFQERIESIAANIRNSEELEQSEEMQLQLQEIQDMVMINDKSSSSRSFSIKQITVLLLIYELLIAADNFEFEYFEKNSCSKMGISNF